MLQETENGKVADRVRPACLSCRCLQITASIETIKSFAFGYGGFKMAHSEASSPLYQPSPTLNVARPPPPAASQPFPFPLSSLRHVFSTIPSPSI